MLEIQFGGADIAPASLPVWVLLGEAGIPFRERFAKPVADGPCGAGGPPTLVDGTRRVKGARAIADALPARFPEAPTWPPDAALFAAAQGLCDLMNDGFCGIKTHCPLLPGVQMFNEGALIWRQRPEVRGEVRELCSLWSGVLSASGGPMLFGGFCAADAFAAPLALRLLSYCLPVPPSLIDYMRRIQLLPSVRRWAVRPTTHHPGPVPTPSGALLSF